MSGYVMTGARSFCYLNGRLLGVTTSVELNPRTPRKSIRGLDCPVVFESTPQTTEMVGSITVLRLSSDGGAEGYGLVAPPMDISAEKYSNMTLVDRKTDTVLFQLNYLTVTDQSWKVKSEAIMEGMIRFTAILWSNEASQD
jgi:hypothetical protein